MRIKITTFKEQKEPIAVDVETERLHHFGKHYEWVEDVIKTQIINGNQYCIINKIYYK